jgi:hypothetical protein
VGDCSAGLPGGTQESEAFGFFTGARDGMPATDAAKRMVKDVLRYGMNIES